MSNIKGITDFLTKKFPDEETAIKYFADKRWGDKPCCPKCKSHNVYVSKNLSAKQPYKCGSCGLRYTVKTGTIMEGSPVKVRIWLLAMYILGTSKKSVSSVLLAEWLGVTQKTAWYMAHRIRETCNTKQDKLKGTVEIDATFIGGKEKNKHKKDKKGYHGTEGKTAVIGAVSREDKQVVAYPTGEESRDTAEVFITNNVEKGSMLYADSSNAYSGLVALRVNHSKGEYVRGDIHTNSIESFWSTVKRAYVGVFHFWSDKHLHRYINEFANKASISKDFIEYACENANGKRLTYKELIR